MAEQPSSQFLISACPSCGHSDFLAPIPADVAFDNSLEALIRQPSKNPTRTDLSPFARSQWRVCGYCGLIFSLVRPVYEDIISWYRPVFEISEKRGYNTETLPDLYLKNHEAFADELFAMLEERRVFDGVRSVLHVRCQTGEFLRLVNTRLGIDEVYGTEYFDHPVSHARARLGDDRVHLMEGPEPEIPFAIGQYDLIVLDHVLTHTHNPRKYFDYLKGMLAPGGRIVMKDKCHREALKPVTSYERGINFFHLQLYTADDLTRFLQSCGMAVERLPDPTPRRWAVGRGSFLVLCTEGEPSEMRPGDVEANFTLMTTWWQKHELLRKSKGMPRFVRRAWGKVIESSVPAP